MALCGPSNGDQRLGAESWLSTANHLFQARSVSRHVAGHMYAITGAYTTFMSCSADPVYSTGHLWAAVLRRRDFRSELEIMRLQCPSDWYRAPSLQSRARAAKHAGHSLVPALYFGVRDSVCPVTVCETRTFKRERMDLPA